MRGVSGVYLGEGGFKLISEGHGLITPEQNVQNSRGKIQQELLITYSEPPGNFHIIV